ncbi:LamG-like jellyroll fold domain-containing protein [Microbacterium sp.]|uniref:LamG-like jellyroll fold domain-containing protein n=1 Tax=Microbacterium sp. TaxID=51671 RepID=UPI003241D2C3
MNGASIARVADHARARSFQQLDPTKQPTLVVGGQGGLNTLAFGATARLSDDTWGNDWSELSGGYAQPNTIIAVAKCSSTVISGVATGRFVVAGHTGSSTSNAILINQGTACLQIAAGSYGATGGPQLNDDTWHVLIGMLGAASGWCMVDGYVTGAANTQSHGAQPLKALTIGDAANGGGPFGGEIAEVIVANRQMSLADAADLTSVLIEKWGIA